jgi:capsular exopolysaccharide synthesis family protein
MTRSFKRYLIAFDRYRWLVLASFVVVIGASEVVALKTKASPIYVANGTLTYNGSSALLSTNNNQMQQQEQILSEDILLSNKLIENVAKDTQNSIEQIRKNINVDLPEKTQTGELKTSVITVKYKDTDPQWAKKTLLAVMKNMEQQSLEQNTNALQSIKKNINGSLEGMEKELKQAEAALAKHDRMHNSESITVEKDNLIKAIADNQTQQQLLQQKLSSIDAQTIGALYSQAFITFTFSTDPSIAKLLEQINQTELKLAELQSVFLPTHPNVIKLQEQLTTDNERLQRRAAEAVRSLRQQLNGLKQSEVQLKRKYTSVSDKQRKRSPFEQQVQRQKALYEPLVAKLKEVEMLETVTVSSWVAQEPSVALEKGFFSQSTPVILGMGALLGVLVGGGLIVLLGSLEREFQIWEEIADLLQERQMHLLGVLPLIGSEAGSQTLPVISPNSPYLEFYERCRINLRSFGGKALKVVLLSSTVNFEGKTVSAYNLGVVSARAGKKTLIVEADLRSPSQSQSLGVTPPENVVEPLQYYGNPNQYIRSVPAIENLYILPSPGLVQQTTEILESNEIQLLLKFARSNFDLVILDTPALGFFNDALLLEPYSDGIVLVTRPQYTEKKLLAEAIAQLTGSEMRLLGVIINGIEIPVPYSEVAEYQEDYSSKAKPKIEEVPDGTRYL